MGNIKTCTKCGVSLNADTKNFAPRNNVRDGLNSHCRSCHSLTTRKRYAENRDKILKKQNEKIIRSKFRCSLRSSVEEAIKSDPVRSNSSIAEEQGISYDMVSQTRKRLEIDGQIPIVDSFVCRDGIKRRRIMRRDKFNKNPLVDREVVYFIQADFEDFATGRMCKGPIKIGTTQNLLGGRMKTIKTHCPTNPKILLLIPGGEKEEKELHSKFAHLRLRGEWHRPGEDLMLFIEERAKETKFEDLVPNWWGYKRAVEERILTRRPEERDEPIDEGPTIQPQEEKIEARKDSGTLAESPFTKNFWEDYLSEEARRKSRLVATSEERKKAKEEQKKSKARIAEILRERPNMTPHLLSLLEMFVAEEDQKKAEMKADYEGRTKRSMGWERRMPAELLLRLKESGLEMSHNICTRCHEIKAHEKFKKNPNTGCLKNICYVCIGKAERENKSK